MKVIGRYCRRVWLGINQMFNTLMGGQPDETVSARAGRTGKSPICDIFATAGDKDHCEVAIENERRGRSQDRAYHPPAFITRRGALQTIGLLSVFGGSAAASTSPVIDLDEPILVRYAGRTVTIYPDALFHALEAAVRMPLEKRK